MFFFKYFATKDVEEAAEKRAIFLSQFNHPSAEAVDDQELCSAVEVAVTNELQFPKTAIFGRIYVRRCSDKIVRGAGMVTFAGLNGVVSTGGYMAEFISNGKCQLIELHSNFDPVAMEVLPRPDERDGKSIPYARPAIPGPLTSSQLDGAFILKLFAMGLTIGLAPRILIFSPLALNHERK